MTRLYENLKARLGRHARYRQTLRELRAMPLDIALDLDIYRGDIHRIASEAVYGAGRG